MEIKLTIGGVGREEILARLQRQGIQLNDYARQWLGHPGFHLLDQPQTVTLRILELGALGCAGGATLPQIFRLAARNGLSPCAPETALFLRLALDAQPQSTNSVLSGAHHSPQGAIVVASERLSGDEAFPAGLYLRHVDGILWLRGYVCGDDYLWQPQDIFAFAVCEKE
ncbi:hypothetical protein [Anaeromassilibacillus senegalensis]|uniref:Helicase n=1 Tax=Anaeromassilibacillus senegalensis TaxID=1673717 RepID=A0ABS9CL64_9FIRM|nr:hypothetical protein [Anaeromassilibacillus senegalensis]MCF2651552.1 hypothetical protein [Anaeromassilibacillus senegalensis]